VGLGPSHHFSIILSAANLRDFDTVIWVRQLRLAHPNLNIKVGQATLSKSVRGTTTLRMPAALFTSLIFTLLYATAAAKSCGAEIVLIPLLDVLQSVPVLGYLSL
jgi:ABC-type proline/glycine betaine transport system permease subunit